MGFGVCGGAQMTCTFGMAPSILNVLPDKKVQSTMAMANIMDKTPIMNIPPFGMCQSMSNPTVAAATAAAAGVLTPMPCVPVTTSPWSPGSSTVLIGGKPALNNSSKLMCTWGGNISIVNPMAVTVMVP